MDEEGFVSLVEMTVQTTEDSSVIASRGCYDSGCHSCDCASDCDQ